MRCLNSCFPFIESVIFYYFKQILDLDIDANFCEDEQLVYLELGPVCEDIYVY